MKQVIENLAKLIDVKSIMSLIAIVIFAVLALRGILAQDKIMEVVLIILTFYFAKKESQPPSAGA